MNMDAFLDVVVAVLPGSGVTLRICASEDAYVGVLWQDAAGAVAFTGEPILLRSGEVLWHTYEVDIWEEGHMAVGASPVPLDLVALCERLGGTLRTETRSLGALGIRLRQVLVMAAVAGLVPTTAGAAPGSAGQLAAQSESKPPPPPPPREPPAPGTTPWDKRPLTQECYHQAMLERGLAVVDLSSIGAPMGTPGGPNRPITSFSE